VLHEFLHANRDAITALARNLGASGRSGSSTDEERKRGVPLFINQLVESLRTSGSFNVAIGEGARMHGAELHRSGSTYTQIVRDYGNVCQAITRLAQETNAPITADEFHTLNRCLDEAIAGAVTECARLRERSLDEEGRARVGAVAGAFGNPLGAALLAYEVLRTGAVGIGGSTGTELGRNLRRVATLIERTMAEVLLDAGKMSTARVSISELVEELEIGAFSEAHARSLVLSVAPLERGVEVDVDRRLLTVAVDTLLQNAFAFSRPKGHVALNISRSTACVSIEVEDECGGLPAGRLEELSRALAGQGVGRAALGPGLTISRRCIEAMGGQTLVRDKPGVGCAFTIELPRPAPSAGTRQ